MRTPGFTADAALGPGSRPYRAAARSSAGAPGLTPAFIPPDWDTTCPKCMVYATTYCNSYHRVGETQKTCIARICRDAC